jgi:hypothetical protein
MVPALSNARLIDLLVHVRYIVFVYFFPSLEVDRRVLVSPKCKLVE